MKMSLPTRTLLIACFFLFIILITFYQSSKPDSNLKKFINNAGGSPPILPDGSQLVFETCGFVNKTVSGKEGIMKRMTHAMTCDDIFQRWMKTNLKLPQATPPREIPDALYARYTQNGAIPVRGTYRSEMAQGKRRRKRSMNEIWDKERVDNVIDKLRTGNWHQSNYDTDAVAEAMNIHKPKGKGLVVGSLSPWVEGAALFHGADHVLTATYNKLASTDPRIDATHPRDMAQSYKDYLDTFDFAASYSSIEHSGLGRYGDTLDPEGDILEMQKVRCWLKDGGLFYFGVPVNLMDAIIFNVHRIYGPLQLPYMFAGFEILSILEDNKHGKGGRQLTLDQAFGQKYVGRYTQPVFVLRKVSMNNC